MAVTSLEKMNKHLEKFPTALPAEGSYESLFGAPPRKVMSALLMWLQAQCPFWQNLRINKLLAAMKKFFTFEHSQMTRMNMDANPLCETIEESQVKAFRDYLLRGADVPDMPIETHRAPKVD